MKSLCVILLMAAAISPAAAETLLRLSETAHVAVHPDELTASLRAEAGANSPAEAQKRLNTMVETGVSLAKQTPGIAISNGFYQVAHLTKPVDKWTAVQSLHLKSADGPALLRLLSTLQAQNLELEQLSWQVSPPVARAARAAASKQALTQLRTRADEAATGLGLKFQSFREVRLDNTRPTPPMPRLMAMSSQSGSSQSGPPPSAEAQDVDIAASAEADVLLVLP